ncbi:MAG: iron-only hydrogenase system regulator [Clostridiales bacterium]
MGVVGIVLENNALSGQVNDILHQYSHIINGRMGLPYPQRNVAVISLIIDGEMDEISAMTGKLGKIKGVAVKTALTKGD